MGKAQLTPEPLMKMMNGAWITKTLTVATELEVFTRIASGSSTVVEMAGSLDIQERPAEALLNACVALGLLEKNAERYSNSPLADTFLVRDRPAYFGSFIIMSGTRGYDAFGKLREIILTNKPLYVDNDIMRDDPEKAKAFTRAMHSNAIAPAIALSKCLDLSRYTSLLDLGGGSGAYSIVLTDRHPNLKASVVEFPPVCEIASDYINKANAASRVDTIGADFMKDAFPPGFDVVLLAQVLHSYGRKESLTLLERIYHYLPSNGMVIVVDFLLNSERTEPLFAALFALVMLQETRDGSSYSKEEVQGGLMECGFRNIQYYSLAGPAAAIVGIKK